MNIQTLLSMPVGGSAVVRSVHTSGDMRRRLFDLGLLPGARVSCLYAAPSGNPRAYLIKDAVIALRSSDADSIILSAR